MYTTFVNEEALEAKSRKMEEKHYKLNKIALTLLSVVAVGMIVLTAILVTL